MTSLYVVAQIVDGYAREDNPDVSVVSVHTDKQVAETVRKTVGISAKVFTVELNAVPAGLRQSALELFGVVI